MMYRGYKRHRDCAENKLLATHGTLGLEEPSPSDTGRTQPGEEGQQAPALGAARAQGRDDREQVNVMGPFPGTN